jgi:hypothetical protein
MDRGLLAESAPADDQCVQRGRIGEHERRQVLRKRHVVAAIGKVQGQRREALVRRQRSEDCRRLCGSAPQSDASELERCQCAIRAQCGGHCSYFSWCIEQQHDRVPTTHSRCSEVEELSRRARAAAAPRTS